MPEKACIPEAALSQKQRELNVNNRTKHNPRQEYLLQTMWDKQGYVVYGEMLDFYLCHGVQMTHIYCIITFRVANWLKPYIELNTKLRNEAKKAGNALGITVFKGMNNFIYGKFLQDVFKQTNLKFLNTIEDAIRTQSLPGFVRNTFHNGNFTIADIHHEKVWCDKPIYLGAAITELVKLHMYRFFYDQVIPSWGRDNVELLMTDTDSLMLEIKTKDLWGDIAKINFYNGDWIEEEGNERNGEIGVFKSKTSKDPIVEFVGLHAKMYSYITKSDQQAHMRVKGVGKAALEMLKHSDYVHCLSNGTSNVIKMQSIRSINQQLYTMEMFKKASAVMT